MVEVVKFPNKDKEKKQDVQEFLDEVKVNAEEGGITQAVVVMMDDEGSIGLSACGNYLDVNAMLAIAMKEL